MTHQIRKGSYDWIWYDEYLWALVSHDPLKEKESLSYKHQSGAISMIAFCDIIKTLQASCLAHTTIESKQDTSGC